MSRDYLKFFYENVFEKCITEKVESESKINEFHYPEMDVLNKKEFYWNSNIALKKGDIPIETTHLIFGDEFNKKLEHIPRGVIYIKFGENFNKKIEKGDLPENLRHIEFGDEFNKIIGSNVFPRLVESIKFGTNFNKKISRKVLPKNLKYLEFGFYFNQQLIETSLPYGLNTLILGECFNNELLVENIPESISKIHIRNEHYDRHIDINLNLTELIITKKYLEHFPHINEMNILYLIKFYSVRSYNYDEYDSEHPEYWSDDDFYDIYYYEYNINNHLYLFMDEEFEKIQDYIFYFETIRKKLFAEELASKVFSPRRLFNIADKYEIEYADIHFFY